MFVPTHVKNGYTERTLSTVLSVSLLDVAQLRNLKELSTQDEIANNSKKKV